MSIGNNSQSYPERQPEAVVLRDVFLVRGRTPDDDPSPEQIEAYRRMTPGRRLEIAEQMYREARQLKKAWFQMQHPAWTDSELEAEVTRSFSHARS